MCVAPVESDKGRLWEAETEALDNGKAYLIDGPTRNTEHATYTHANTNTRTHEHTYTHTHTQTHEHTLTRLPN